MTQDIDLAVKLQNELMERYSFIHLSNHIPLDICLDIVRKVWSIEAMEVENVALRKALEARCEYHHLPLNNGWSHQLDNSKVITCRLSKKEIQALAATKE